MTVDVASLVSDSLDVWTTAIEHRSGAGRSGGRRLSLYGVERLRALILDLGIRGKLATQSSKDEPAAELLDRIPEEWTTAKRRHRGKPGNDDHKSGASGQPSGWIKVPGNVIFCTRSGNSKLIKGQLHQEYSDGLFPGFSASGQDIWLDGWEHEGTAIILSAVGARCGKAFLATGKWSAVANTHIIWLLDTVTIPEFAMLVLNNEHFWIRAGGAQPFVKVGITLDRDFYLPPLDEQITHRRQGR
jgi:type I restriction enzyme, S subunit